MEEAVEEKSATQRTVEIIMHIVSFLWLPLFLLIIVADDELVKLNPQGRGPWPDGLPRVAAFDKWIFIRIVSYMMAISTALITLPRIQAVIGLLLVVAYFFCQFSQASTF